MNDSPWLDHQSSMARDRSTPKKDVSTPAITTWIELSSRASMTSIFSIAWDAKDGLHTFIFQAANEQGSAAH
jgi:hypothetical protein